MTQSTPKDHNGSLNKSRNKTQNNSRSKLVWDISLTIANEYDNHHISLQQCSNKEILEKIEGGDYILIPETDIIIHFDYPLIHPIGKRFHHAWGFSRKTLLQCIYRVYRELYTQSLLTGHTLEELMLVGLEYDLAMHMVTPIIES